MRVILSLVSGGPLEAAFGKLAGGSRLTLVMVSLLSEGSLDALGLFP